VPARFATVPGPTWNLRHCIPQRSDCLFLCQKGWLTWLLDENLPLPKQSRLWLIATVRGQADGFRPNHGLSVCGVRFNVCLQSRQNQVVLPSFAENIGDLRLSSKSTAIFAQLPPRLRTESRRFPGCS
jgi:hypothetical protein